MSSMPRNRTRRRRFPRTAWFLASGIILAFTALMGIPGGALCRAAPETAPADRFREHVQKIIDQLDDADPATRRAATLQLNSLSGDALDIIESALKDGSVSPESQARLKLALKYIRPRARTEKLALARRKWEAQTLHDAYQKFGHTDSARDAAAHKAIDLFLTLGPDPLHGPAAPRAAALGAFDEALGSGNPRDSLLWCLQHATRGTYNDTGGNGADAGIFSLQAMAGEHYPPAAEMIAGLAHLRATDAGGYMDCSRLTKLLPLVAALPDLPAGELDAMAESFYEAAHTDRNLHQELDAFSAAYRAAEPKAVGPCIIEARRLIDFSYSPDEGGWPAEAKPDLDAATKLLQTAASIDPNDPRGPSQMLAVLFAVGAPRDEYEIWYARAMANDPDNYAAAYRKLGYLNIHGTPDDLIQFGRECLATQNWSAQLPYLLSMVHYHLANRSADSAAYYRRPEVWSDFRAVNEGAVLNFPDNLYFRSTYARAAALCERWDVAWQQFQIIGDNPDMRAFVSQEVFDYLRRKARRLATAQTHPAQPPAFQPN